MMPLHYRKQLHEGDLAAGLDLAQVEVLAHQGARMVGANMMLGHVMQRIDVMFDYPIGDTPEERHNAIVTRIQYLFGESIGDSENLGQYRALLDNAVKDSKNIEEMKELLANALVPVPDA